MKSLLYSNFTSFFFLFLFLFGSSSVSSTLSSSSFQIKNALEEFLDHTAISVFRLLNRRSLHYCLDPNPYIQISISSVANSGLSNNQNVTVTVSGVLSPSKSDWVAMISPSNTKDSDCPLDELMYLQTGDTSHLPLICHYPVKAQFASNDPDYLSCNKTECQEDMFGLCVVKTCSASLTFHVINIRTPIEFVFFSGGFDTPCVLKQSESMNFSNPNAPLYGHLSSVDSTGESMRLTWVSGDKNPQHLHYGDGNSQTSEVTTFTQDDMCSTPELASPAKDFGWHDPGYIHTAVMSGLQPSTCYSYRYGSDSVGWSDQIQFCTPPAGGSAEVRFLAYGDMGKAPHDDSVEHYIQPGSISVTDAVAKEVATGNVDSIFHIGDISYATGFLVEWDFFLQQIGPLASHVSYMTAIGNHERDYPDSGSVYVTTDSGGECGVAYETYFPMPKTDKDKPWYSVEQGPVHFTLISTENDWSVDSEQYKWMETDMGSVDRSRTPWLIFIGHRPMYSTMSSIIPSVDPNFVKAVEPLLTDYKVDLALWGHVHNYERTCAVYKNDCKAMPVKDAYGVDTYNNTNYSAPVHSVIGMAGFELDQFPSNASDASWSLVRIAEFGYVRFHATVEELNAESPAEDFGWHDPGFIHSAVMTGLQPSKSYSYRYGGMADSWSVGPISAGWSDTIQFRTPPAGGSPELKFLAFGDMGKAPYDGSIEHFIQPGSISVVDAMAQEVASGNVDSIFHIGDISYATGFLVEWDYFLHQIHPVASHVSYMTAIGNHERDYIGSGSIYITPDSGGECGVPYETYFPMPTSGKDKPWYSIEQGPVHFTVISTEHDWKPNSEQYQWIQKDLSSVDRSRTPWLIFAGHRPMYSSASGGIISNVDPRFVKAVEPLLMNNKVDLVLWGHIHNYERTCAVYQNDCKAMPTKDKNGIDTYDNRKYNAPVHLVIGMAGFELDDFPSNVANWSLVRISEFGYARFHATRQELKLEYVNSKKRKVLEDSFRIIKR